MKDFIPLLLFLFFFLFREYICFTSVYKLSRLLQLESKMLFAMDDFLSLEKTSFELIHRQTRTIKEKNERACQCKRYVENPINAFHLISRYANDWKTIFDHLSEEDVKDRKPVKDLVDTLNALATEVGFLPNTNDLIGASYSLLRLWKFYQLNLTELFEGHIFHSKSDPLSDEDVFFICRQAGIREMYFEQIVWLDELLERMNEKDTNSDPAMESKVVRALASAFYKYGMPWESVSLLEQFDMKDKKLERDYKYYLQIVKDLPAESMNRTLTEYVDEDDDLYMALCRKNQKNETEVSSLKCYHRKTSIPYLRGKEEVANNVPRISLFHDVISDRESNIIRTLSEKLFVRSTVVKETEYNAVDDLVRVSETAWIKDDLYPNITEIHRITRRIGLLTGLSTQYKSDLSDVEQYQVLNYGIGGMYHPHVDILNYPLWGPPNMHESLDIRGTGDRIATWMFYINDVEAGGATVFPMLNARIPVVKGAAAFWYNLLPSGEVDSRSLHAGCPVLLGSKWVSNKWIRQSGQVFKRMCRLTPQEEWALV